MKAYLASIHERNHEQEYTHYFLIHAEDWASATTIGETIARNWYPRDGEDDEDVFSSYFPRDENVYTWECGRLTAEFDGVSKEVPWEHYELLTATANRYLPDLTPP